MSRISNAFRLAKITPQANGLEMFVNGANEKLSDCLHWLEFPFPLAYRRKELRGLDPSDYFAPMVYTTAREWFRLEPDDTCKAFSFWYSEDDKTSLNSFTYTQNINLVIFANTELIFEDDGNYTQVLINQTLQALRKGYFFDSIPTGNDITVTEGFDNAWEDFDIIGVNGQRFIKENYCTFKVSFDVVYNIDGCLSCVPPVPPVPIGEYVLDRRRVSQDLLVLAPNNPEVYDIPSTGLWKVSITCNIDDLLSDTRGGVLISRTWTNNIGINAEKWRVVYQGFAKQFFFVHRINLISLDISQLGLSGYVKFTFGFDDNGSFIEANGVEIARDGNTARPLNQPQIEGVVIGAAYQNFNGGNSTFVDFFKDLRIQNIEINNEEWRLNEGQGFSVTSENGITGEGQTSSPDGLNYWNQNVWLEIL